MKSDYSFVTRVENTPFSIIKTFDDKFAITIGNNVVSKPLESQEECIHLIEVRDWELFINSVCAVFTIMTTIDKLENINNEHETKDKESTNGNS